MNNLQKLIECWRPIEEYDGDPFHHILGIIIKGAIKGVPFECYMADDSCWYTRIQTEPRRHTPTHYMPLDTPEKLAKIVGVLVEYMRKIEYVYDDGAHELVKVALQQAEQIAGGGNETNKRQNIR